MVQPPYIEITALVTVCVIAHQLVKWLLNKGTRVDAEVLSRIDHLEREVIELRQDLSRERHLKHEAMAQSATYLGTLRVIKHMVKVAQPAEFAGIISPLLANVP